MAFDTFMYFTGTGVGPNGSITMAGETTDTVYAAKKAFEIYSFSWGASNPVTIGSGTTGTGGGKVSISSFNIMKKSDSASPLLFTSCSSGVHFPLATVVMRKSGGTKAVYLTYTFTEVYVESVQWSGSSGGDDTPTESVSFAFQSVNINYWPQTTTGGAASTPINGSWDVTTNTPATSTPATS
jgi:type VI secretion system secreted protein Hcp